MPRRPSTTRATQPGPAFERFERREMLAADADVLAYRARSAAVLDANVASIRSWATANAAVPENASTSGISIWTVAAAYARSATDATLLPVAEKAAASLLARRATSLFVGGNDGWEAWATADTYLRYRGPIDAATGRYAPTGLAANPASVDGRYTLRELFKHVLTKSFYAPIDSTSNHVLMNATARYLAEQAFPGEVAKPYNNSSSDPTGAGVIRRRAEQLVTGGPAEYLSLNYGAYNWAEFLSVHQLTTLPADADLALRAKIAFEAAFAMNAAYWMNGQLAGPVGRGYPNTGGWGASGGDALTWTFLGGDYGKAAQQRAYAASTDVKALGVLASVSQFGSGPVAGYSIPVSLLKLDDPVPKVTQSNFGTNHQYAYNTGTWSTYSESYKWDAYGPYQATWRSRTMWTKPETQNYEAVAWATNPATDPGPNADGSWTYVDPYTLRTWDLSGSGTYSGSSVFSDMVQNLNTVLQVYNIPPLAIAGTPGGKVPVRGSLIYVPVPKVIATGADAADGDGWFRPVISLDSKRLFVAYEGIFMCFLSTAPISLGSRVGQKQFYNIYGGTEPGQQADQNSFLQYAIAQETFSAADFPGTTFAEKFANFQTVMNGRQLPALITADTHHPAWRYADDKATLTCEFGGIERYAKDPKAYTKGFGQDFIAGPGNTNPMVVDYAAWPLLAQTDLTGRTWSRYTDPGTLSVTVPGQTPLAYDFVSWRSGDPATLPGGGTTSFSAPTNLRLTLSAANQVQLAWTNRATGAAGVRVEFSLDDTQQWQWLANVSATTTTRTITNSDFTGGERVYYRVRAYGNGPNGTTVMSPGSNIVGTEFSTPYVGGTLSMPRSLRAVGSPADVRLSWTDTATNETGYRIERSADAGISWAAVAATLPANTTAYTDASVVPGSRYAYRVIAFNGTAASAPSNTAAARAVAPNTAPTVARPAAADALLVAGTSARLTVLGADDAGEAGLRYVWTVTAGPGAVAFDVAPGNAAKATIATFSRAGTYTLTATISDTDGLATTSVVTVTVAQTLTTLSLTPGERIVAAGSVVQFAAAALDQFGMPLAPQPAFSWSATAGAIDAAGRFTAPAGNGVAVIAVSAGSALATATLTHQTRPVPLVSYDFEDPDGATARDSSALGFQATLSGGVAFGPGAPRRGSSTRGLVFSGTGVATIGNQAPLNFTGGITMSAWVKLTGTGGIQSLVEKGYNTGTGAGEIFLRVNSGAYQVGSFDGTTAMASVAIPAGDIGTWVHLTGTYDTAQQRWVLYRNGIQAATSGMTTKGAVIVANRPWTIGATALGNRFFIGSIDDVRITNASTSAADALALHNASFGPTIPTPPVVTGPVAGAVALSVLGASPTGESRLTYSWSALGPTPAPVTFSANGTNAARNSTATFTAAGTYRLALVVSDAASAAAWSLVTITVASLHDHVIDVPDATVTRLSGPVSPTARIIKRGTGTLVLAGPLTHSGGTVVEGGELVVADPGALGTGGLEIRSLGRVTLSTGYAPVALRSLEIEDGGRLDIGTGRVMVAAGGFTEPLVRTWLVSGRAGGTWAGVSGITSRAAPAGSRRAVGLRVASGVLTVAWAAPGDINLDGRVNSIDVSLMNAAGRFNRPGTNATWSDGDFNYDGRVNTIDVSLMNSTGLVNQPSYRTGTGTLHSTP